MTGPQARMLPDGARLHLNHGPIDLIVGAAGPGQDAAFGVAAACFESVLNDLVAELPDLRSAKPPALKGAIARRMQDATSPFAPQFITPMAAVAGAVADHVLLQMSDRGDLQMAYVNNGGDIAFHLTAGVDFTAAMPRGTVKVAHSSPWRGIATSGRGGRSHSLGIADSVTVLARTAAMADAAATMIANAIDLPGHPAITRIPANALSPDSDLGAQKVTTGVGRLTDGENERALAAGAHYANALLGRGLIGAAHICLNGHMHQIGAMTMLTKDTAHA